MQQPTSHRGRPIDPKRDFYPPPLMVSYPSSVWKGDKRIEGAVWFLQANRMEELITTHQCSANTLLGAYSQTPLNSLCCSLPSNFRYDEYKDLWLKMIKFLIEWPETDINSVDGFERTPILNCARYGMVEPFKMLLDAGAKFDEKIMEKELEEGKKYSNDAYNTMVALLKKT